MAEKSLDALRIENEILTIAVEKFATAVDRIIPFIEFLSMLNPGGMEKGSIAAELQDALEFYNRKVV